MNYTPFYINKYNGITKRVLYRNIIMIFSFLSLFPTDLLIIYMLYIYYKMYISNEIKHVFVSLLKTVTE